MKTMKYGGKLVISSQKERKWIINEKKVEKNRDKKKENEEKIKGKSRGGKIKKQGKRRNQKVVLKIRRIAIEVKYKREE